MYGTADFFFRDFEVGPIVKVVRMSTLTSEVIQEAFQYTLYITITSSLIF